LVHQFFLAWLLLSTLPELLSATASYYQAEAE
jgi:hypothetical protein